MEELRELHLFIVWNKALYKAADILADLQSRFTLQQVYSVQWSEHHFSDNLARLHGNNISPDLFLESHCGRGRFLAILVVDDNPRYGSSQTTGTPDGVNLNCVEAKKLYQAWTGDGHRIYATDGVGAAHRDIFLLLHQTSKELLFSKTAWDGGIEQIDRDVLGAEGWTDFAQFFRALNELTPYAVIRNFENLPDSVPAGLDLDLLCRNRDEVACITNALRLCPEPYRALYRIMIGGQQIGVHFRTAADNYFDPAWAQHMLQRRVLSPLGFYHLGAEDYFYSLLYHLTLHRPAAASQYRERLSGMASKAVDLSENAFRNPARVRQILNDFFKDRQYRCVEPNDLSIDFNLAFANLRQPSIERVMSCSKNLDAAMQSFFSGIDDCSVDSDEFRKPGFRSERTARHFSANRAMFLQGLSLPRNSSILHVGTELGIVTRWLGERFESVTALEGDDDLIHAVRTRCRDLQSVRVVRMDDETFKAIRRFDVTIAFLGAPLKTASETLTPILKRARQALKQAGLLVLGFDVSPNGASVRNGLTQQLKSYGFNSIRFFSAFPNATLPRAVFTTEAVELAMKSYGYWAAFAMKEGGLPAVNDLQVAGFSAQGKLDEMALGCYVLATRDATAMPQLDWQVYAVSSEFRPLQFRTAIQVSQNATGLFVRKNGTPLEHEIFRFRPLKTTSFFEGHNAAAALRYAAQSGDFGTFLNILRGHATHLIRHFSFASGIPYVPLLAEGDTLLRGEALDAIPRNAVIQDDSLAIFDLEWQTSIPVPLSYVLYRGLTDLFKAFNLTSVFKNFKLTEHGLMGQPTSSELCLFLLKRLGIFGKFRNEAVSCIEVFEARVRDFMANGRVAPDKPCLFEKYHLAISHYAQGQFDKFQAACDDIRTFYPGAPEPLALVEEPIA